MLALLCGDTHMTHIKMLIHGQERDGEGGNGNRGGTTGRGRNG